MLLLSILLVAAPDAAFGDRFVGWLARGDAAAIHASLGPDMKAALTPESNAAFVRSLGAVASSKLVRTWTVGADTVWLYDLELAGGPAYTTIARGPAGVTGWYVRPRAPLDAKLG